MKREPHAYIETRIKDLKRKIVIENFTSLEPPKPTFSLT